MFLTSDTFNSVSDRDKKNNTMIANVIEGNIISFYGVSNDGLKNPLKPEK